MECIYTEMARDKYGYLIRLNAQYSFKLYKRTLFNNVEEDDVKREKKTEKKNSFYFLGLYHYRHSIILHLYSFNVSTKTSSYYV